MITVYIGFGDNFIVRDIQKKSFKDEISAIEFCRRNYHKIQSINDTITYGEVSDHFTIMDAIRKSVD